MPGLGQVSSHKQSHKNMIICLVHKLPKHCHKLRGRAGKILKSRYTWYAIKALVLRDGGEDINLIELSNQKTQPNFFFF